MKTNIYIMLLAGFMLLAGATQAQSTFRLNYQVAVPMGATSDFIDIAAFRGMNFEWLGEIQDDLHMGFEIGWNFWHKEYDRQTYDFDNGAVTINQWRYKHVVPLNAILNYDFAEAGSVKFYAKYGLGVYWVGDEVWAGLIEIEENKALFGMVPGLGFTVEPGDFVGVNFATEYQFIVNGQLQLDGRTHSHYWNFKVGLNFHRKSEFVTH